MKLKLSPGCFYGVLSKRCEVSGLRLTEIIQPPEHKTLEHSHEQAYFSLTLRGVYTKFYGETTVKCTPQTLVFHPPDQRQSGYCDQTGSRSFIIEIEPQVLDRFSRQAAITEGLAVFREGMPIWIATRLYQEFRHLDELSPLAIEGLSLEMMVAASRRKAVASYRSPPRWLEQAKEVLEGRFTESLTIADVAEAVGVHPVYLAGEFRKFYRATVGEYVRKLRIDFACHELAKTRNPLSAIALAAGFCSQSHFCATFKRLTGVTPTEYRASFRSP